MTKLLLLPGRVLDRIMDTRFMKWLADRPLMATLFLVAVVVFWSFPSYDVALVLHEHDANWNAVFLQAQHPFTDHAGLYDPESHSAKIGVRFVPALLMRAVSADTIVRVLLLQFALLVLFYFLLLRVMGRFFHSNRSALLFALPFCFVISGHVYASDYRGIFDVLALDLLLLSVLWRRSPGVIFILLLAYFTDVRALLASTSIIMLNTYLADQYKSIGAIIRSSLSRANLYIFSSWILYFLLLEALYLSFGLHSTSVDWVHYFTQNIPRIGYGLYIGLEGFLILAIMVQVKLYQTRFCGYALLLSMNFLMMFLAAMSVVDINRSLSYLLVFQILLLVILVRSFSWRTVMAALGWTLLISLFYDDFFPLVAQVYRMAFITHTISS